MKGLCQCCSTRGEVLETDLCLECINRLALARLKTIRVMREFSTAESSDCERIIRVLAEHGYRCSFLQAEQIWVLHSAAWDAGWLRLPASDAELFDILCEYFTPES